MRGWRRGPYELRSGVMPAEQRDPTVCNFFGNMEGKGEMIKAPISLQDLRRRIYIKAKAESAWRLRQVFGWKRWSRRWLYEELGLFNNYRVKRDKIASKALSA